MADIIFPGEVPAGDIGIGRLPQNTDLTIWQGDMQLFYVRFTDELGNPMNLTGYTPLAIIRSSFNSQTGFNFTCTVQNVNEVKVYMPSSVSGTLQPGDYVWNFQLTDPNGDTRTYLAGDVTVYAEVD